MKISEIMTPAAITDTPSDTLAEAAHKMWEQQTGSLLVVEGQKVIGIITERDILRACAAGQGPLVQLSVAETMTKDLIAGNLDDSIEQVLDIMTERRVRHLPVMADGQLLGLVSIGDVVKARQRQTEFENHYLKSYIQS